MARRNDQLRTRLLGWVLALLAVMGQVAGAAALPECCQGSPAPFGEICGIDHAPAPGIPAAPHGHQHDCAVCPFCAAMAVHVAVLGAEPMLPAPTVVLVSPGAIPPPARAPPPAEYHPGKPRGPPVLT